MDKKISLTQHLTEARSRIIASLIFLVISIALSFPFAKQLIKILKLPAQGLIDKLVFFSPEEGFLIYMRVSFALGIIISLPFILYQFFRFVLPAIDNLKRNLIIFLVLICLLVFIAGVVFAYFLLLPNMLKFLLSFNSQDLQPLIAASQYISFVTNVLLIFGLVFQMPVISFLLTKLGIINARFLISKAKYIILAIFIIAAILTPTTDVFNLLVLAIPMLALYGVSILVSRMSYEK